MVTREAESLWMIGTSRTGHVEEVIVSHAQVPHNLAFYGSNIQCQTKKYVDKKILFKLLSMGQYILILKRKSVALI